MRHATPRGLSDSIDATLWTSKTASLRSPGDATPAGISRCRTRPGCVVSAAPLPVGPPAQLAPQMQPSWRPPPQRNLPRHACAGHTPFTYTAILRRVATRALEAAERPCEVTLGGASAQQEASRVCAIDGPPSPFFHCGCAGRPRAGAFAPHAHIRGRHPLPYRVGPCGREGLWKAAAARERERMFGQRCDQRVLHRQALHWLTPLSEITPGAGARDAPAEMFMSMGTGEACRRTLSMRKAALKRVCAGDVANALSRAW